jgi:hypothetical protein
MAKKTSTADVSTYGLYQATFKHVPAPGTKNKRENWLGKLPTNSKSSGGQKFKK